MAFCNIKIASVVDRFDLLIAAWMPTDNSRKQYYLSVALPNIAIINKLAIQGGHQLSDKGVRCWTDE